MSDIELKIYPELEVLLPPLEDNEASELEELICKAGEAIDPIWIWGDVIIDGHNRYRICKKHGLPFTTKKVLEHVTELDEVKDFMYQHAIGKRNLSDQEKSRIRAIRTNYLIGKGKKIKDAQREVAEDSGVSERQVARDRQKMDLIEQLDGRVKGCRELLKLGPIQLRMLVKKSATKQLDICERAGWDHRLIHQELMRQGPKKKTEPFSRREPSDEQADTTPTKKDQSRVAARPAAGLAEASFNSLVGLSKNIQAMKQHMKSEREYHAARHHLKELDKMIARWREQIEESL